MNKWDRTCKSLRELLDLLNCSKCDKSICDSRQISKCGHFSCNACFNNNNLCKCPLQSDGNNIINNDVLEKIIRVCCSIAKDVGFSGNINGIINEEPLVEQVEDVPENKPLLVQSNTPYHGKKRKKRKKVSCLPHTKTSKKIKVEDPTSKFIIPKNINKQRIPNGETKLHEACRKNQKSYVKLLLEAGADPNLGCNALWTPLQESTDFGYYEIVKMLLEAKADVDKPGHEGRTALHHAAIKNNLEIARLLLEYGAKKDVIDVHKHKPMDYCQFQEMKVLLNDNEELAEQDNEAKISGLKVENQSDDEIEVIHEKINCSNSNKFNSILATASGSTKVIESSFRVTLDRLSKESIDSKNSDKSENGQFSQKIINKNYTSIKSVDVKNDWTSTSNGIKNYSGHSTDNVSSQESDVMILDELSQRVQSSSINDLDCDAKFFDSEDTYIDVLN